VLQEAWKVTAKHFFRFLPAIIGLFVAQIALLLLGLKVQLGDPNIFFNAFITGEGITPDLMQSALMANFWSDVLIAPLYAGVSLSANKTGTDCTWFFFYSCIYYYHVTDVFYSGHW